VGTLQEGATPAAPKTMSEAFEFTRTRRFDVPESLLSPKERALRAADELADFGQGTGGIGKPPRETVTGPPLESGMGKWGVPVIDTFEKFVKMFEASVDNKFGAIAKILGRSPPARAMLSFFNPSPFFEGRVGATFGGLLRKNEEAEIEEMFKTNFKVNFTPIYAAESFLEKLKGITDPEQKRKIVGEEFIRIFTEFAEKNGPFKCLAQGTLYPDVIESGVSKGPAAVIKSHHNVGGLPDWLNLEILEPLRELYKDEVRKVGKILGISDKLIMRHPFPGPGLAVRIIGEVTPKKLEIVKVASKIVEEELAEADLYDKVWQAYAAVGDDKAVGVVGDERKHGNIVMV
ncbi:hypothetical protein LCGC14_3100010, partial [marine sediment metagenome]